MLLPRISTEEAPNVIDRLRHDFEWNEEPSPTGERIPVTSSGGISSFPRAGGTLEDLIATADRALYDSKRSGRNKIFIAKTQKPTCRRFIERGTRRLSPPADGEVERVVVQALLAFRADKHCRSAGHERRARTGHPAP